MEEARAFHLGRELFHDDLYPEESRNVARVDSVLMASLGVMNRPRRANCRP